MSTDVRSAHASATGPEASPLVCGESGCERPARIRCDYTDRDGGECPTRRCATHIVACGRHGYCRRHAGVVTALPEGTPLVGTLPPVDNRAISLLHWTGDTLGPLMGRILAHSRPDHTLMLVDPVHRADEGDGLHHWRRSWSAAGAGGAPAAVELDVTEEEDTVLRVLVDGCLIGHGTPPWIDHRWSGDDHGDTELRRDFYDRVMQSVIAALAGATA